MGNRVAIVGIGQTKFTTNRPDVNHSEIINESVRAAMADAELGIKDIEASFVASMDGFEIGHLADHWAVDGSGAYMKSGFRVSTGGTTAASMFCETVHMVAAGFFDIAMVVGYQKQDEGDSQAAISCGGVPLRGGLERPPTGALGLFAQQAQDYMEFAGATEEHAAKVRLKVDRGAMANPYAHLRLGLKGVQDYLDSPFLVWPLRLLDFCPQSAGSCTVILASEEKAKKITNKPVWVVDTVTVHQELFRTGGVMAGRETGERYSQAVAAERLYKRNGITNPLKELDMAEIYEPSTWQEMLLYEHFHWCDRDKGWTLIEKGITEREGSFPVNPSGGVIAANAIGACPLVRISECALQIRKDAGEHQVDKDVNTAFAHGLGGVNWTVLVLLKKNL